MKTPKLNKEKSHKELELKFLAIFVKHIEENNKLISITELCKEANISRTTFYKHFSSTNYFFDIIIDRFVSFIKTLINYSSSENYNDVKDLLNRFLKRSTIANFVLHYYLGFFTYKLAKETKSTSTSGKAIILTNARTATILSLIISLLNNNSDDFIDLIAYSIIDCNAQYNKKIKLT